MAIYVYEVINEDGSEGDRFEMEQSMQEAPLTRHPETGVPVRRVYLPPNLGYKHTEGHVKKLTSNESVERAGFTKYVKDRTTGRYHKEVGRDRRAPEVLDPRAGL